MHKSSEQPWVTALSHFSQPTKWLKQETDKTNQYSAASKWTSYL